MSDETLPACACPEFSRAGLVRRAVAEAGSGLPAIEPGMPLPAGTGLSRRTFLLRSAALGLAVYGGTRLGSFAFEDGIAQAASGSRVLVSVFLEGGIDSLSVLFPDGDPSYRALRPTLALPNGAGVEFAEDTRLRWHPSALPLATLHGEGKLTVLPAVGYDHPDKSHFTSRHYWEVGATDPRLLTGWLGRYLDRTGSADNPLQGLSLDTRLQPALATARVPVAALDGADRYGFSVAGQTRLLERETLAAASALGAAHARGRDAGLRQAGGAAVQSHRLSGELRALTPSALKSPVAYPESARDEFPHRLAGLAAMLAVGLPLRCVALTAPGHYDTHANQPGALSDGLKLTAESLLAFQRDLESRGLADRVLVHVWSEFGRRARENGSNGTDHGAAGVGFLLGTRVAGRMVGEFPGLGGGLDEQGNLRATSDFRAVYAALVEQWLETDPEGIVPGARGLGRPQLLR